MASQEEIWNKKLKSFNTAPMAIHSSIFADWAKQYFPLNGQLLELGAGLGRDALYFAKLGYQVTATDFADSALKLIKQSKSSVIVQKLDLNKTFPFEDASYDIVFAHLSLHYFNDQTTKQIFNEIFRVLKNDCVFAALLNSKTDPQFSEHQNLGDDLIELPSGKVKRFFSVESLMPFLSNFKIKILDNQGEAFKLSEIKTESLIRLIATK